MLENGPWQCISVEPKAIVKDNEKRMFNTTGWPLYISTMCLSRVTKAEVAWPRLRTRDVEAQRPRSIIPNEAKVYLTCEYLAALRHSLSQRRKGLCNVSFGGQAKERHPPIATILLAGGLQVGQERKDRGKRKKSTNW